MIVATNQQPNLKIAKLKPDMTPSINSINSIPMMAKSIQFIVLLAGFVTQTLEKIYSPTRMDCIFWLSNFAFISIACFLSSVGPTLSLYKTVLLGPFVVSTVAGNPCLCIVSMSAIAFSFLLKLPA